MKLVTIELSDRDAKWLETHEKEIVWLIRQSDSIVSTANIEKRVAAKVAKQLVFDNNGYY